MDTTMFLAKLLGLWFLLAGFTMLLDGMHFKRIMDDFFKSPALVHVTSVFIFVLGLLMVLTHNVWEGGVETFVTVIAWLTLLKGVAYFAFPSQTIAFARSMKFDKTFMMFVGVVALVLGAWLSNYGFELGLF
jgi:hypothetical protein